MESSEAFNEAIKKAVEATNGIGPVVESVESKSRSLRTVITRHQRGFCVQHYRRYFQHINGVEIPNTSEWVLTRCQQWSMGQKLFDIADATVLDDPVGVPGDIDG